MKVICIIGVEVIIDATVGVNDGADRVSIEREQNWSKDRTLGNSILERSWMGECTTYLDRVCPS